MYGELAGYADYIPTDTMVVLTHTEVDESYEGRGVGGALARGALEDIRSQGLTVLPLCPFIRSWRGRHPDYQDVVYSAPPSKVHD